jgi:hypothetical protein
VCGRHNSNLSAQGLLEIHKKLAAEAWAQIGQAMLYNIVMWLQEQVPVILAPLRAAEEKGTLVNVTAVSSNRHCH